MSANAEVDSLVDLLAQPSTRRDAAERLARALGCEEFLLLVLDPDVAAFMPAPGMPKTLHGGPLWRGFLQECRRPGAHVAEVDLPSPGRRRAWAMSVAGGLTVALGGQADGQLLHLLERRMGLLGPLLASERALSHQDAELVLAREGAARAHSLLAALDAARATAAELNVRLTQESRRKDEFLAMLAHELRNPLAPLVNSVELLRRMQGQPDPVGMDRAVRVMSRQLSHMTRLVSDLLDVSRVSRGAIRLERELLTLEDVLQFASETAGPLIQAKRHRLVIAQGAGPIQVLGDRARLVQVFANLLHNAAKFTDPGGTIEIATSIEGGRARVTVSDNGLGISPEQLDTIFGLFSQAHSTLARTEGGLGIGLTLARTLVELHGGTIEARSRGLGCGSAFVVDLPTTVSEEAGATQVIPVPPPSRCRLARVLLVETDPARAASMRDALRQVGAEVLVATDAEQAFVAAVDFAPEIVLLHTGLADRGREVAMRLRSLVGCRTRLVALTDKGAAAAVDGSRPACFDENLCVPATEDALRRLLRAGRSQP